MDHRCHILSFVAAGTGEWLHDGWRHSRPVGHRHRCGVDPGDPGPKASVRIWTLAGENEVFGKEVVSRHGNALTNHAIPSVEKIS